MIHQSGSPFGFDLAPVELKSFSESVAQTELVRQNSRTADQGCG